MDTQKIVIYKKICFCKKKFKYFIGQEVIKKDILFCIMPPKMSGNGKNFDETQCVIFYSRFEFVVINSG